MVNNRGHSLMKFTVKGLYFPEYIYKNSNLFIVISHSFLGSIRTPWSLCLHLQWSVSRFKQSINFFYQVVRFFYCLTAIHKLNPFPYVSGEIFKVIHLTILIWILIKALTKCSLVYLCIKNQSKRS